MKCEIRGTEKDVDEVIIYDGKRVILHLEALGSGNWHLAIGELGSRATPNEVAFNLGKRGIVSWKDTQTLRGYLRTVDC